MSINPVNNLLSRYPDKLPLDAEESALHHDALNLEGLVVLVASLVAPSSLLPDLFLAEKKIICHSNSQSNLFMSSTELPAYTFCGFVGQKLNADINKTLVWDRFKIEERGGQND